MWRSTVVLIAFTIGCIKAQTGGTTANGDMYVCVPPGYCDNNGTPRTPGIDPRIVTPGVPCPVGQIACYTQGPNSPCGNRFVSPTSTTDGIATVGAHPWQAFISNSTDPRYAGSGVLIDNYHILTAAHKVAGDVKNASAVTVRMGVYNPVKDLATAQTRKATRIEIPVNYNRTTLKNDIAIIRVSPPFSLSGTSINSACLPVAGSTAASYANQSCMVAGWGETAFRTRDQPVSPIKQVNIKVTTLAACKASYANILGTAVDTYLDQTGGELCAGGELQKDACTYDGGAPLICPSTGRGTIAGLVIWGKNCGLANVPGVYVAVPAWRNWILSTIASLNG